MRKAIESEKVWITRMDCFFFNIKRENLCAMKCIIFIVWNFSEKSLLFSWIYCILLHSLRYRRFSLDSLLVFRVSAVLEVFEVEIKSPLGDKNFTRKKRLESIIFNICKNYQKYFKKVFERSKTSLISQKSFFTSSYSV